MNIKYYFAAHVSILISVMILAITDSKAAEKKLCIALTPQYSGDCTAATANQFAQQTAKVLKESGVYTPMDLADAADTLATAGVSLKNARTRKEAAINAGRVLKVREVIYSSIAQTGKQFTVWMNIYDTATGTELWKAGSAFNGTAENMISMVPGFLLKKRAKTMAFDAPAVKLPAAKVSTVSTPTVQTPAPSIPAPSRRVPEPVSASTSIPAYEDISSESEDWSHLEIGTRMLYYTLFTDSAPYFQGSNTQLDPEQDLIPAKWFIDWMFIPELGMEVSWDKVAAKSVSDSNGASDGTYVLSGPCISFVTRYPGTGSFHMFAGIGAAYLPGDFEAESWWRLGYQSPSTWETAGSPATAFNGITRKMEIGDEICMIVTGGLQYHWTPGWSTELYFRMLFADADADYKTRRADGSIQDSGTATVPMDSWAIGLGVRYSF